MREGIEKTLFVKKEEGKLIIAQTYVDDIVFGGTSSKMEEHFVQQMESKFEMSFMVRLHTFLVSKEDKSVVNMHGVKMKSVVIRGK